MQALAEFKTVLVRAASLAEEVSRKQESVTTEEEQALTALIELVQPILPVIAVRIETAASHSGHQMHSWESEYLDKRGLTLVDGFGQKYTDRDYRGDYTGHRLVLTAESNLIELERFGHWSNWQGGQCYWHSEKRALSVRQAVEEYDFADVVSGLAAALKEAAEKQEKRITGLEQRLEVLEQVRAVLRGDTIG